MLADPLSYDAVIATPVDSIRLGILVAGDELASIDLLTMNLQTKVPLDALSQEVVHQLQCYFEDSQRPFSLPLVSQGSDFQCLAVYVCHSSWRDSPLW